MSWPDEVIPVIRELLADVSDTPLYSDERLQQSFLVAATQVLGELDFGVPYKVSITNRSLTPDPTDQNPIDDAFITLVSFKTLAQIEMGEFRAAKNNGFIRVSDGTSSFDNQQSFLAHKLALSQGYAKIYADAKLQFKLGTLIPGRLVATPFSSPNIITYGGFFFTPRDRLR